MVLVTAGFGVLGLQGGRGERCEVFAGDGVFRESELIL
jgi:hypothetical protein